MSCIDVDLYSVSRRLFFGSCSLRFFVLLPIFLHRLRIDGHSRFDDVLGRMRRERPAVWDYITDYGALWPDTAEAAMAAAA